MLGWLRDGVNKVADKIAGVFSGNVSQPVGNTLRGGLHDLWNGRAIAAEDWQRSEQSAHNQFERDMAMQAYANENASIEAEKAWERTMEADNTKIQRAVEDMKTAGINPIMAINGGFGDVPSSPTASASSARSSGSNYSGSSAGGNGLGAIASILAGLITKGKSNGTTLSQTFNKHGELVRSTINSRR